MTRYSASRGIRYTAPPGPDGERRDDEPEEEEETAGSPAAEVEADGGRPDATADD